MTIEAKNKNLETNNPLDTLTEKEYKAVQRSLVRNLKQVIKDGALEEGREDHRKNLKDFWSNPLLDTPLRSSD